MKRVITNTIAIAAVAGAMVLFGISVKDLATWKISGLDSLRTRIDAPKEPPSIVGR